jgi:galactose-1-phosphate uridylyltransferase
MTIPFRKIKSSTRILNPFKGYVLDELPFEIRFDPLTGETGRVLHLPFKAEKPKVEKAVQRSGEEFCPFCPEVLEKSTPMFPEDIVPGGRMKVGRASVIPNLLPFDRYAGVTIFSDRHFIPMEELTPVAMMDAFMASLLFLKRIEMIDPAVRFFSINWNYMPPAGSSIVHAHLQPNASSFPTNHLRLQLEGAARYAREHQGDYWTDFIEAEKRSRERFIGEIGTTFWAMNFLPMSFLPDVSCIFPGRDSLSRLGEEDLTAFVAGLAKILRAYLEENVHSFNVAIFAVRDAPNFRINARICPRLLPRPIGNSDIACQQMLHRESYTVYPPETVCPKFREVFNSKSDQ